MEVIIRGLNTLLQSGEVVTLGLCEELYKGNKIATIVKDGKVVGFAYDV